MTNELTLWGIGTSRTMRAHWTLLELGLDYSCHSIRSRTGETLTDEFIKLNPRHKIPVLRHGSFLLTESAAIVQYLMETFGRFLLGAICSAGCRRPGDLERMVFFHHV